MDRLRCSTAIFQMMATNAITGSILKEAPRRHDVTRPLEFKKERYFKLHLFPFPQLSTASMEYHADCERLVCKIWLKIHNSLVIRLLV